MATAVTGHTTVFQPNGDPYAGIPINIKMVTPPPGGGTYLNHEYTVTSDVNGEVEIPNLLEGAVYAFWIFNWDRLRHKIDLSAFTQAEIEDPDFLYELPSLMGQEISGICGSTV